MGEKQPTWVTIEQLSKSEAEDCLDWLQAHGIENVTVTWDEEKGFTITYPERWCGNTDQDPHSEE